VNEQDLRDSLRRAAGTARPTDATWAAIVDEAGRRTSGRGSGLRRFRVLAAAAAVLALGAVSVVALQRPDHRPREIRAGVPSVTGGSADLIVESGTLTDEGGYAPVPGDVATEVAAVDGVRGVVGVVRAFARLSRPDAAAPTPSVVVSWDGGDGFELGSGRAPAGPDEVALTPLAAARLGVQVGDAVQSDTGASFVVVGTFSLPGDGPDVVLAAMTLDRARVLARVPGDGFTRLHVELDDDADPVTVRDAVVATTPPGYRVVGVNQLGTTAQLRDELEIQQAYFDLMSPDGAVRAGAVQGAVDDETSRANFERFRAQAAQGTLRIQRYSFLDTDHVEVVYAIYYGPNRSPIVTAPQRGTAVRSGGRWKLARTTLCGLASLVQLACDAGSDAPAPPPDGWADPATEPALVDAFRTMADTRASLEERVETVVGGEDLRDVVRAGLDADQRYAGKVSFHVSGVRRTGGGAQVLYAVLASGDPVLETPYPLIGAAVFDHGRWRVGAEYACGLVGLVSQWCPPAGEATTTTSSVVEAEATTTTTTTTAEVLQEGEQEDLGGVGDEPGVTGEVPEGHVG
jgi:hypothetical protein